LQLLDRQRLQSIVLKAGELAMLGYARTGSDLKIWEKVPGHPVCETDLAVDAYLRTALLALIPGSGWLSEETADNTDRLKAEYVWLVDPIDGTRDFVRGRPGWSISIALAKAGQPLLGILYAPARQEYWESVRGEGAKRNGSTLTATNRATLPGARVPTDRLPPIDSDLVMVEKPNSIALRMAMVAADEADLVATLRWGFEWDVAAAALIAEEAGALVTDAWGQPLHFNKTNADAFGVLCCAPAIHAAAVKRLVSRSRHIETGRPVVP